jgi:hypothetical protein
MKNLALAVAGLALALSACGGDAERPSVDEIEKAMKQEDNVLNAFTIDAEDSVVTCMAEALHDSDVSNEALQAIVDNDEGYDGSSDDEKAIEDVTGDLLDCTVA